MKKLGIFLILLHVIIFCYANTRPIYWAHQEMFWHGFFWSMDDVNRFTLHTGFWLSDFLKPFYPYYVEAAFRLRQVSYLFDMVSFKVCQLFGQVLLRNYALIALHLVNVVLVGRIIFALTGETKTAWVAAVLFLNSGAALATLLFPFRSAKLLVMAFFFMAWLLMLKGNYQFKDAPLKQRVYFYALVLLALLSDEMSYFLIPLLPIFLIIKDGRKAVFCKRLIIEAGVTLAIFALLAKTIVWVIVHAPNQDVVQWNTSRDALKNLLVYVHQPVAVIKDLGRAFFAYFLRRNFGYWDFSLWGILAGGAALTLFIMGMWKSLWSPTERKLMLVLIGLIVIKAILLPHNSGVHGVPLMPEGTFFPSLLFFSYYYTYCESALFAVLAGLFLNGVLRRYSWTYGLALACSVLIGLSAAVHLKNGPEDTMRFHLLWDPWRQQPAKNVLMLERQLINKSNVPIYTAFNSNGADQFKGRIVDVAPKPYSSCYYVFLRHLEDIKNGKVITSLSNVRRGELSSANTFTDMENGEVYDLNRIKQKYGSNALSPVAIGPKHIRSMMVTDPQVKEVVFFVKGLSYFIVQLNNKEIRLEQTYGTSYQMFRFVLKDGGFVTPILFNLTIVPKDGQNSDLVGPFEI